MGEQRELHLPPRQGYPYTKYYMGVVFPRMTTAAQSMRRPILPTVNRRMDSEFKLFREMKRHIVCPSGLLF